ncbi:unnamed protein product [Sphagnum balticum]
MERGGRCRILSLGIQAWREARKEGERRARSGEQLGGSRRKATLAYEEFVVPAKESGGGGGGDNKKVRTALVVHGLLGAGRNWRTVAKRLATAVVEQSSSSSGWRMVLVDLRNHGNSARLPGFIPPHDIPAAARDLAELVQAQGWEWPDVLIAHSLGGKVVLDFTQNAAAGSYGPAVLLPKQVWVLDSVPGEVETENSDGEVERVLAALQSMPHPIPSRRWLTNRMQELGFSKSFADWMGSNLRRIDSANEKMEWVFDVQGAHDMFLSYRKLSYWSVLQKPPQGSHIALVRAALSDRWTPDILAQLEAVVANKPHNVSYHVVENAGHWLHIENASGLIAIMAPVLAKIS